MKDSYIIGKYNGNNIIKLHNKYKQSLHRYDHRDIGNYSRKDYTWHK